MATNSTNTKKRYFRPQKSETKPKPDDGLVLDGAGTNWELFESLYKEQVRSKFGRLVDEFDADQDIVIEPEAPEAERGSFEYTIAMETIKLQLREKEELRIARYKLYGDIFQHLSLLSERKVRQHEDFVDAEVEKSPRLLWAIVKATHITPQHAGEIGVWILRDQLSQCKQGSRGIEEHCRRFKSIFNQLIALNDEQITQQLAKEIFLISLNGDIFGAELARWATSNAIPETLDDAIQKAITWFRTSQNAIRSMGGGARGGSSSLREETAFQVVEKARPRPTQSKSKPKLKTCPICNKKGSHTPDQCWELEKFCSASLKKRGTSGGSPAVASGGANASASSASVDPEENSNDGGPVNPTNLHPRQSQKQRAAWAAIPVFSHNIGEATDHTFLDTGASVSIWTSTSQLTNLRKVPTITLKGINGDILCQTIGVHPEFGEVVVCPSAPANLLSIKSLKHMYKLQYNEYYDSFKITSYRLNTSFYFDCNEAGLYQLREDNPQCILSAAEAEKEELSLPHPAKGASTSHNYSKSEVKRALAARELCKNLGHVGARALVRALKSGSIIGIDVTAQDVYRAERILGPCLGCKAGKITRSNLGYEAPEIQDVLEDKDVSDRHENLHADLFFLPGASGTKSTLLLSVGQRHRLIVVSRLRSKHVEEIEVAWRAQVSIYRQHGIQVNDLFTDNEANLGASRSVLAELGINLIQQPSGAHEPYCERRVRVVKERMRAVLHDLPFDLPARLYWRLLLWVVQGINITPDTLNVPEDIRSAYERVVGLKINLKRLCNWSFGQPVMYHIDNHDRCNTEVRSGTGIVVGREFIGGDLSIFDVSKRSFLTRKQAVKIPLSSIDEQLLLTMAAEDINSDMASQEDQLFTRLDQGDSLVPRYRESFEDLSDSSDEDYIPGDSDGDNSGDSEDPVDPEPETNFEIEEGTPVAPDTGTPVTPEQFVPRYNLRPKRGLVYNLSIQQAIGEFGGLADEAIREELRQMLKFDAFAPTTSPPSKSDIVIPSSLFLKEKRDSSGNFLKLKARLVAGGHRQPWDTLEEFSSPTVSWDTVLMALSVAAKHSLSIAVADVPSAYLQAKRDPNAKKIIMKLAPGLVNYLVELKPEWNSMTSSDGGMMVLLLSPLYGLKESGLVFHQDLSNTLSRGGFVKGDVEPCAFTNATNGRLNAIVLSYVDDLLILGRTTMEVARTIELLRGRYGSLSLQSGNTMSFVGVTITNNMEEGKIKVSCEGFIERMSQSYLERGEPSSPPPPHIYRGVVMSLMYLARRVRPDILYKASLLATKSSNYTQQDFETALRIIRHVRETSSLGISYSRHNPEKMRVFADASFACHPDGKGHTGILITFGGSPVIFRSNKQKTVAKSTTDSELLACDKAVDLCLWAKEVYELIGEAIAEATPVFQDNQAAIMTMLRGSVNTKRRTTIAKLFYLRERVQMGDIQFIYVPSEEMMADGLTKELIGSAFNKFRDYLLT